MNKHTATPPAIALPLESSESNTQTHYLIYDRSGRELARQLSKKDAAYIVKSVNAHEALVEALQDLLATSATMYEHTKEHCKSSVKLDYLTYKMKAERALKLAGEETKTI